MNELFLGKSEDKLKNIESDTVDLIVTSPPYAKQRDYNGATSKDYEGFILPIMLECKRVLKPNGSFFFNIKEHCENGQRSLYVAKLIIELVEKHGFLLIDEFIWNKTNPFPTGSRKRLKDGFERVFHFTKTKKFQIYPENVLVKSESKWLESEKKRKNKAEHNTTNGSKMNMSKRICSEMVRPSNVLTMSSSNLNIGHPAVYPDQLAEFFIKLGSQEGDTILDPFMGSGTTCLVAKRLKRSFIGVELNEEYFQIAKERINE